MKFLCYCSYLQIIEWILCQFWCYIWNRCSFCHWRPCDVSLHISFRMQCTGAKRTVKLSKYNTVHISSNAYRQLSDLCDVLRHHRQGKTVSQHSLVSHSLVICVRSYLSQSQQTCKPLKKTYGPNRAVVKIHKLIHDCTAKRTDWEVPKTFRFKLSTLLLVIAKELLVG